MISWVISSVQSTTTSVYRQVGKKYAVNSTMNGSIIAQISGDSERILYYDYFHFVSYVYQNDPVSGTMYHLSTSFNIKGINETKNNSCNLCAALNNDGSVIVLGNTDVSFGSVGGAFIFKRNALGKYDQMQEIPFPGTNLTGEPTYFGTAIACNLDCSTLAIGAKRYKSGSVFTYRLQEDTYKFMGEIRVSNIPLNASFGTSVALNADGNYLLASASSPMSGKVYGFRFNGARWIQLDEINAPSMSIPNNSLNEFGFQLAMNHLGTIAVIGSLDSGAYVYGKSPTWQLKSAVKPNNFSATPGDYFGSAVSINGKGTLVAVSAPGTNNRTGESWVFAFNGVKLTQQGPAIIANDASNQSFQGYFNSLNEGGALLVVTSGFDDNIGAFTVYRRNNTKPVPRYCRPRKVSTFRRCTNLITRCSKFGIKMKFGLRCGRQRNGRAKIGTCQCDQYCGYPCKKACNNDPQCFWKNNVCYNAMDNTPGVPISVC